MIFTTRKARLIVGATVLACTAIVAPAFALAAPAAPRTLPLPCETPGLVIWMNTPGKAALGSTVYKLNFTNLSGSACTLNGFPYLYAVNLKGQQLGRVAGFSGTPHQVTIGNGKTTSAMLSIVNVANYQPPSSCNPKTAAGLKVFPPNQQRAKTVPFPFRACGRPAGKGPTFLSVGPVH